MDCRASRARLAKRVPWARRVNPASRVILVLEDSPEKEVHKGLPEHLDETVSLELDFLRLLGRKEVPAFLEVKDSRGKGGSKDSRASRDRRVTKGKTVRKVNQGRMADPEKRGKTVIRAPWVLADCRDFRDLQEKREKADQREAWEARDSGVRRDRGGLRDRRGLQESPVIQGCQASWDLWAPRDPKGRVDLMGKRGSVFTWRKKTMSHPADRAQPE